MTKYLSWGRRQDLYLVVILVLAAFLCTSAIVAIPEVSSSLTLPDGISVAKLRERLIAIDTTTPLPDASSDGANVENPFGELRAELRAGQRQEPPPQTPSGAGAPGEPQPPVPRALVAATLRYEADLRGNSWASLDVMWRALCAAAQAHLSMALEQTVLEFEKEDVGRFGTRQTIDHYYRLVAWYQAQRVAARVRLTTCQTSIEGVQSEGRAWIALARSRLDNPSRAPTAREQSGDLSSTTTAFVDCQPKFAFAAFPVRKPLSTDLGPLQKGLGWLVNTESMELTLIIGMFGFGLLGSAISSIVNFKQTRSVRRASSREKAPHQPLVSDLGSVLIRGISAAIVVYLGVKGGIAVFLTKDSLLNPYVMLLTCFVAAVYSDRAWMLIRKWFEATNRDDDEGEVEEKDRSGAPPAPPGATPPAPAPAVPVGTATPAPAPPKPPT